MNIIIRKRQLLQHGFIMSMLFLKLLVIFFSFAFYYLGGFVNDCQSIPKFYPARPLEIVPVASSEFSQAMLGISLTRKM